MTLILMGIEGSSGISWLVYLVGGICLGALGGDFNVTIFPNERSGEARLCLAMVEFFDFISEQGLMDLSIYQREAS
jgi:hypothetical protein